VVRIPPPELASHPRRHLALIDHAIVVEIVLLDQLAHQALVAELAARHPAFARLEHTIVVDVEPLQHHLMALGAAFGPALGAGGVRCAVRIGGAGVRGRDARECDEGGE